MNYPPFPFTVIDTETTGFLPRVHRVIEFACARVEEGKVTDEYAQLFAADDDIPPLVQVLTRIRPADIAGKPHIADARFALLQHIGGDTLLVGQNLGYDLGMLKGEGIDLTERHWLDTSALAALLFPELASYSLGYLSAVLKLPHDPVHRALGDVHATLALLCACWERLQHLPPEWISTVAEIFAHGSSGQQIFAAALPQGDGTLRPARRRAASMSARTDRMAALPRPTLGTVELREESLDIATLETIARAAAQDRTTVHWIAVKNLESAFERLPRDDRIRVLRPPSLLLDLEASARLLAQSSFTAEEASLAVKLRWFLPRTRAEVAVHGEERDVWSGKLACTESSPVYAAQFRDPPSTLLLDHEQLFAILANPDHPGAAVLQEKSHIVVDDASMLEDTATKAFGIVIPLGIVRAGAQGHPLLEKFVTLLGLWIARTCGGEDDRILAHRDLATPEAKGMREQLLELLHMSDFPAQIAQILRKLAEITDPGILPTHIVWIETRRDGDSILRSAPRSVALLLQQHLYRRVPTTLLIPPGSANSLSAILPPIVPHVHTSLSEEESCRIPISCAVTDLSHFLGNPPQGKSILLVPSKRRIEEFFVRFSETLERKDVTMLCQGTSGGQSRMEAEFISAAGSVVWLLTPWMYEGIDLPVGSVEHLVIESLPFDHPSHPVIKARSKGVADGFTDYQLPRLEQRLFRILRTFYRHRTESGRVQILDRRLFDRDYGSRVRTFLHRFSTTDFETQEASPRTKKDNPSPQLRLF